MKNIKTVIMMIFVGAAFLGGCAATKQARSVDVSGFLNEYKSELKPGVKEEGVEDVLWVYKKPDLKTAMKKYSKLMLAPVTVWDNPNHPMSADDRNDLLMLADSFHAELYDKLSKYFEMVDQFGPGTIRVQVAIIHGEKHTVGLSFISKVVPQARAANLLWSFATGKPAFTGSAEIEFKATDAVNGELLWAGADRRVGGQKLLDKNVFKSWGDVQNAFTYWSELAAYRMCNYRGDANCAEAEDRGGVLNISEDQQGPQKVEMRTNMNDAKEEKMKNGKYVITIVLAMVVVALALFPGSMFAADKKPNILFIMGDDIGWMQPSIYHRGLMVGETPNIDRIGNEGAIFMHYYAEQSCTAGRTAFFTGIHPLRAGMIPPQLPGSPTYLLPGTPALAKFLFDLGYNTGEFGKNHLGDHTDALPTAHGFQEFWGYLYHLDAMQGVSFNDINSSPTQQGIAPPCKNTPVPGLPEVPGAVDPKTTTCLTPPRPVLACKSNDGTSKNQTCKDEGPLTLERSRSVDEEISAKVIDFLDRNDPKKTNKPFFVWYNPARMHITTMLPPKYEAMLGEKGGKDWGINEAGMKQMDDNIGYVLKKLQDMGELDNTIVAFTTDNGAEVITYPDGGTTPFKGGKLTTWEGGMRAPLVVRWPGHIKPGTVKKEIFASLDWLPTLVDIAGGPKGDALKKQIEAGKYPGIVKTTLDGVDQRDYLEGKSEKSARDTFFYYTGPRPSAVRYKNWKFYYTMVGDCATCGLFGATSYHWTQIDNILRDPFEVTVGADAKSLLGYGGALAAPSTAYLYNWNILPIGQLLWLKELESYVAFPPMQDPASYNLDSILKEVKQQGHRNPSE